MTKTQMVSLPLEDFNNLLVMEYVVETALKQCILSQDYVEFLKKEFKG